MGYTQGGIPDWPKRVAHSSSGQGHRPLKAETTGSNPVCATNFRRGYQMPLPTDADEQLETQQIRDLVHGALPEDSGLTPLPGFKMDLSANPGFRKVFFAARCECGTSALLSIEVAREKTIAEIEAALPSLVDRLVRQQQAFASMSCEMHMRMRLGPSPSRA